MAKRDVHEVASNATGLLLIGGLVAYAGLFWGYGRFYGAIGLSPTDVGLSYIGILARSTVVLAVVGLPILLLLMSQRFAQMFTLTVGLFLLYEVCTIWWVDNPVGLRQSLDFVHSTGQQILATVQQRGQDLYNGKRVDDVRVAGVTLFGYRATPATLRWATPDAAAANQAYDDPTLLPCVLYLGEANGRVVVYDPARHRVHNLKSGEVDVTLDARATCRQAAGRRPAAVATPVSRSPAFIRARLRIDGRGYRILFPCRTTRELARVVDQDVRVSATRVFRQWDGSLVVIDFRGSHSVEVTAD